MTVLTLSFSWAGTSRAMTFAAAPGSPVTVGGSPWSVAAGDFNHDGKQDLATANGSTGSVSVLLGDGRGGTSAAAGSPIVLGNNPDFVAVGDFNGDNKPDLAVANDSGPGGNSVYVLLGNGDGSFTAAAGSPFFVGSSPKSIAVGDFNGDNKLDLAVANSGSNNVTVLLGNGSGGFSAAPSSPLAVGSGPDAIVAGDFNGDHKPDLAVANENSNTVSLLLGDGSGGFSAASGSPFPVGSGPSSVLGGPRALAMGDFNGDGNQDLAVANLYDKTVSVELGDGSGGFTNASGSPFSTGQAPFSLAVADLNGDGRLDLAVGTSDPSHTLEVMRGNGDGTFTAVGGSPFAAGHNPYGIAAPDLNGDGRPDLAVVNYAPAGGAGTVATLLNAPPDTFISTGMQGATRSTTATFTFGSHDDAAAFSCQLDGGAPAPCTSPASYSGLGGGSHSFRVSATNDVGLTDITGASTDWTVDLSSPPTAALTASPSQAVVGQPVTLDASGSHDLPGGAVVDYKWDLQGSGNFDHDTGSRPTISSTYAVVGTVHPRVRITDAVGGTATATADVDVRPSGEVGMSINNGDYATNTPNVQLYVVWPAGASTALISNDGGFGPAGGTSTVPLAATIPWTLRSQGSERLPKIVYLRFGSVPVTYTDDIILDTTTPVVQSASTAGGGTATDITRLARAHSRTFKVRVHATERLSGISAAQFSTARSAGTTVTFTNGKRRGLLKLSRVVSVRMVKRPRYVRVRSAAGNWSKWRKIV